MRIIDIIIFVITYIFIYGVWQFLFLVIHKKGYELEKLENETFFDFMCRYYSDDIFWKIRKKLGYSWIYNSKIYESWIKFKGIIFIVIAIVGVVGLWLFSKSDYFIWLSIEL